MPTLDEPLLASVRHAFGSSARVTSLDTLVGDASTRIYQRVHLEHAPVATAIAMRLPPDALAPSMEPVKACSGNELPFTNMLRALEQRRIRVPALYADLTRVANFTVLLEDLGDETLFVRLAHVARGEWSSWYASAVDLLANFHAAFAQDNAPCVAFGRHFDRDFLRWELDHFREWGLEAYRAPLSPTHRAALDREFDSLAADLCALPSQLSHRDFQSKNLMVLPDDSLAVIDFQDALRAPRPYDLVALLCDSYVALSGDEQHKGLARYAERRGLDAAALVHEFHTQTVQRKLKDAGRFVFIDRVRKNASYLQFIPQSVRYVKRALRALPERERLHSLLGEIAPEWFGDGALDR
jgi:aminoglycoside/choline kinase family phosphotransferase